MKRKLGSSLVLVTVIVATIVIIAFGASRTALVQFSQSNSDEDNVQAYYAAKAGIEDGLIRYRYNPDVETREGKVFSFDLTNGHLNPNSNSQFNDIDESSIRTQWESEFEPFHQYYDLKISFKGSTLGNISNLDNSRTLTKDNSLQLSGFSNPGSIYYLHFKLKWDPSCNLNTSLVQFQQILETAGNNTLTYEQITAKKTQATQNVYDSNNFQNLLIRTDVGNNGELSNYVRIRSYGCDVKYAFETVDSSTNPTPNIKFDNLKTYIIATGYFGSAKRTLIAEVDRTSGRLISIYDFNLYAGQGDVKP